MSLTTSTLSDLDLFGKGGLFELLCTVRTRMGEERLAQWLKTPRTFERDSRTTREHQRSQRPD